jgi:hypothetical protein
VSEADAAGRSSGAASKDPRAAGEGDRWRVASLGEVTAYLDPSGLLRVGDHSLQIGRPEPTTLYEGHWRRGNYSHWNDEPLIFEVVEVREGLSAVYVREITGETPDTIVYTHTVVLVKDDALVRAWEQNTVEPRARLSFPGDGTAIYETDQTVLRLDPDTMQFRKSKRKSR